MAVFVTRQGCVCVRGWYGKRKVFGFMFDTGVLVSFEMMKRDGQVLVSMSHTHVPHSHTDTATTLLLLCRQFSEPFISIPTFTSPE